MMGNQEARVSVCMDIENKQVSYDFGDFIESYEVAQRKFLLHPDNRMTRVGGGCDFFFFWHGKKVITLPLLLFSCLVRGKLGQPCTKK